MEKLIELLNEWSETAIENKCNWTDVYDEEGVYFLNLFDRDMTMEIEDVISKRNGFIKWLTKNDYIDRDKIEGLKLIPTLTYQNMIDDCVCGKSHWNPYTFVSDENELLMLLAIDDNPIEFLISMLK